MTELPKNIRTVPIAALRPSPMNPRKHMGNISELEASIREQGVLEPVMARPIGEQGDELELVFGHRRHAAAKRAGVTELIVIIRELTDAEALELMITENAQREDVHPLDEADGYAELLKRAYTVSRIAERVGKSVPYVAQRLKLCGLSKACRKALDDEQVSLGVALELAKLPTQALQEEALKVVSPAFSADGLLSVAEARKAIEEEVMRALKGAPFDQTDATLVPKAGACGTCSKRTGCQTELFPDASSPDLCTDPPCFKAKVDAAHALRVKEHKAAGGEVMTKKDAQAYFGHAWGPEAREVRDAYKPLDERVYTASGSKTVKQLFGKEKPPTVLAMDPEKGLPVELVATKDLEPLLRKANKDEAQGKRSGPSAAEKKRAAEERREAEIRRAVAAEIGSAAEQFFADELVEKPMAEIFLQAAAESAWAETLKKVADRRDMPELPKGKSGNVQRLPGVARILLWAKDKPANVLLAVLLELLTSRDERNDGETAHKRALKLLGIDPKKVAAQVVARKAKPKGKAKPASEDPEMAEKIAAADRIGLPHSLIAKTPKKKPKAAKKPAKKGKRS